MRIAFLTPEYVRQGHPDGGLANYLVKITALLRERGHDPVVFLAGEAEREQVVDGTSVVEVRASRRGARWPGRLREFAPLWAHWRAARRMARAVLRAHAHAPFDVVQSASYGALGGALVTRCPVPFVVRLSSFTPLLRAASGAGTTLGDHLQDWQEIRQLQLADLVIGPSRLVGDAVERLHGLHTEVVRSPFTLVHTQEDPALFKERLAGKTYLLYFGSLNRVKGVDLLARALSSILSRHSDLHVALAGRDDTLPGEGPCSALVRACAGGDAERVHLLGRLERSALLPVLRNARLVVLPSRVDNYPNTCLEAQALGKIVVALRGSSLDEMIEHGQTGFLADEQTPEALADAVHAALAQGDEQRQAMTTRVGLLAGERTPARAVDDLLAAYEQATAMHRTRQAT